MQDGGGGYATVMSNITPVLSVKVRGTALFGPLTGYSRGCGANLNKQVDTDSRVPCAISMWQAPSGM